MNFQNQCSEKGEKFKSRLDLSSNLLSNLLTCFKLPEIDFQLVPWGVSKQAPFLYQIFSLLSIAHTCPLGLQDT